MVYFIIFFRYNLYGLWQTGWCSNVRIRNIFGYLNLRSLIHADTKYDWLIDGVMSQSDGNHGVSETDAPFYLTTRQVRSEPHGSGHAFVLGACQTVNVFATCGRDTDLWSDNVVLLLCTDMLQLYQTLVPLICPPLALLAVSCGWW